MSRVQDLTVSQRRWLRHLESCQARGEAMSAYAARKGLSVGAMYEAARMLRRKGKLTSGRRATRARGGGPSGAREAAFVRVPVARGQGTGPTWRAQLPNGVVLEGKQTLDRELVSLLASL